MTDESGEVEAVYTVDETTYELTSSTTEEAIVGSTVTETGSLTASATTSNGGYIYVVYDDSNVLTV